MGFHAYLQRNNIPFESIAASGSNYQMFKQIKDHALQSGTRKLAVERGACPDDDSLFSKKCSFTCYSS